MRSGKQVTLKFISAILFFILPIANGFGEISVLIDFSTITVDAEIDGIPVNEKSLLYANGRYRSYLPSEWLAVPYAGADRQSSDISLVRRKSGSDVPDFHDTWCMRINAEIDSNSPGFFIIPPFPPDPNPKPDRLEITESGEVTESTYEYTGRSRFENFGLIHHGGHIQGAEMRVRNLKDPVKITMLIEDDRGKRAGIPFELRFSGDAFVTLQWKNSLRDLWIGEKDNLYHYIRIVGIQIESVPLTDFLQERRHVYEMISSEEEWKLREQDEKNVQKSTIILDILSLNLIYGDHYVEPWVPEEFPEKTGRDQELFQPDTQ